MESEDDESSGGILGGSGLSHDLDDDRGQEIDKIELINIVKLLGSKLEDLQTCHDLIVKHGLALQRSLGKQARKGFWPPSAMKGIGYFQNLRNLLRIFLEFFRNFLGIF